MLEGLYARHSIREMAEKLGYSMMAVHYRLRKHGIKRRARGGANKPLALREADLSKPDWVIAERYGVNLVTVQRERKRRTNAGKGRLN